MTFDKQLSIWTQLLKENEEGLNEGAFSANYISFEDAISEPTEKLKDIVVFRLDDGVSSPAIENSILDDEKTFVLPVIKFDGNDREEVLNKYKDKFTTEGLELISRLLDEGDCVLRDEYSYHVDTTSTIKKDSKEGEDDDMPDLENEVEVAIQFDFACDVARIDKDKISQDLYFTLLDFLESPAKYVNSEAYNILKQSTVESLTKDFTDALENAKLDADEKYDSYGNEYYPSDDDEENLEESSEQIDEGRRERDSGIPLNKIDRRVSPEWWMTVAAGGNTSGLAAEGCKLYPGKKVKAGSVVLWKRGEVRGTGTSITWPEYCFAIKHKDAEAMKKIEELGLPLDLDLGIGFNFDDYFVGGAPEVSQQAVTEKEEEIIEANEQSEWEKQVETIGDKYGQPLEAAIKEYFNTLASCVKNDVEDMLNEYIYHADFGPTKTYVDIINSITKTLTTDLRKQFNTPSDFDTYYRDVIEANQEVIEAFSAADQAEKTARKTRKVNEDTDEELFEEVAEEPVGLDDGEQLEEGKNRLLTMAEYKSKFGE